MFKWKGKIVSEKEYVVIAKTTNNNFKKAQGEIKKLHSYKIPCILKINADANSEYLSWMKKEVG